MSADTSGWPLVARVTSCVPTPTRACVSSPAQQGSRLQGSTSPGKARGRQGLGCAAGGVRADDSVSAPALGACLCSERLSWRCASARPAACPSPRRCLPRGWSWVGEKRGGGVRWHRHVCAQAAGQDPSLLTVTIARRQPGNGETALGLLCALAQNMRVCTRLEAAVPAASGVARKHVAEQPACAHATGAAGGQPAGAPLVHLGPAGLPGGPVGSLRSGADRSRLRPLKEAVVGGLASYPRHMHSHTRRGLACVRAGRCRYTPGQLVCNTRPGAASPP